jgi:hypothetical protein
MNRNKTFCNHCQQDTWHDVLHSIEKNFGDESHHESIYYSLVECRGCESVKFLITEISDNCDREFDGTIIPEETHYPPKVKRLKPKWIYQILFPFKENNGSNNLNIFKLIDEIYISLQNNCTSLAVMGVRAVLENVMIQKSGDQGSFKKNMAKFRSDGYISDLQYKALEIVLEAGHAAIHRSYQPSDKEIVAALDITENIIESIYILNSANKQALKNVPKKNPNNSLVADDRTSRS